jgi:hypothetical protein
MAQAMPRYCPRCGTPTRADMRYCATCELPVEAMFSRPGDQTESTSLEEMSEPAVIPTPRQTADQAFPAAAPSRDFLPSWSTPGTEPPASAGSWDTADPGDPGASPWTATQAGPHFSPPSNPWQTAAPQSPWGTQPPPYPPQPQAKGQRRTAVIVVLLVILLVLGGGSYLAFSLFSGHFPGLSATQAPITTKSLNLTFPYAGIDITLLTMQQAQNFINDPYSASDGMLRLNLQEHNRTKVTVHYDYTTGAHLLVRGKSALAPTFVKSETTIAPGGTQTSVVDFAVPGGGKPGTLVLQIGTASEARLQIPLSGQASLSQYQPATVPQHGTLTYFGLTWLLTSSTTSLSLPGQQAPAGMKFLTLAVRIDNPLSQEAISGSPFDYMRVRAGGTTAAPISTTVPVSFAVGATGKTGTATFLIPQKSTTCTFILLSQDPAGSGQASTDIQL